MKGHRLTVVTMAVVLALVVVGSLVVLERTDRVATHAPSSELLLAQVDQALAARDFTRAVSFMQDAYASALGSRHWDALIAVGDAQVRLGDATQFRSLRREKARRAYLAAFLRARQQGALEGVVRSAEAFAALGDRDVATQCLKTAQDMAAASSDPQHRQRVAALADRLTGRLADQKNVQLF